MAMSDAFGLGDGINDLSGTTGLAESRVPRASGHQRDSSRWPAPGGVVRVIGVTLAAIVVLGWLLTAINA